MLGIKIGLQGGDNQRNRAMPRRVDYVKREESWREG